MMNYWWLPYVSWLLGGILFIKGFMMIRKRRMTPVKKHKKPSICGIADKMKTDWNVGQTAGENFGLAVRQKMINFFKGGGKNA